MQHELDDLKTLAPPTGDDALLRELVTAERDIFALASAHDLSLEALARWFASSGKADTLARLCQLADLQCQAMLSRYRLIAASRLIAQAGNDDGSLGPEQVRKACVDLLKASLTELPAPTPPVATDEADDPALVYLKQILTGQQA